MPEVKSDTITCIVQQLSGLLEGLNNNMQHWQFKSNTIADSCLNEFKNYHSQVTSLYSQLMMTQLSTALPPPPLPPPCLPSSSYSASPSSSIATACGSTSNNADINNTDDCNIQNIKPKKRPPTPPRKPKINRAKLPGYPFRHPAFNNYDDLASMDKMSASASSLYSSSSNSFGHNSNTPPLIDGSQNSRIDRDKLVTEPTSDCANSVGSPVTSIIINIQPYSSSSLDSSINKHGFDKKNQDANNKLNLFHHHPEQPSSKTSESMDNSSRMLANIYSSANSSTGLAAESTSSLDPETNRSIDSNDYDAADESNNPPSSKPEVYYKGKVSSLTSTFNKHAIRIPVHHHDHLSSNNHPDIEAPTKTYDIMTCGEECSETSDSQDEENQNNVNQELVQTEEEEDESIDEDEEEEDDNDDDDEGVENLQDEAEYDEEQIDEEEEAEEEEGIYDTVAPDEVSVDDYPSNGNEDHISKGGFHLKHNSSVTNISNAKYINNNDVNSFANYVNIDYFLRRKKCKNDSDNETQMSQSMSSDQDLDVETLPTKSKKETNRALASSPTTTYDEVFEPSEEGAYYGVPDSNTLDSQESENGQSYDLDDEDANLSESEKLNMQKCILSSIIDSETVYVDCLNTLIQYKKALKSTTEGNHPLLSLSDLDAIFHKIEELYKIHIEFLEGVKKISCKENINPPTLGDLFKILASRLGAYSAFLKNYSLALETVQRCSSANNQFSDITRAIKCKSMKSQSVTLEELLHKPVARVQKNALILHDLLKYTSQNTQEYKSLRTALKMTQSFLNELNIAATEQMFPIQDKNQRRLVKESFIIEMTEGRRKLRHLFLFNDTIVCAKYKPSTRQKFTFDVKWYALLNDISLPETEEGVHFASKEKELSNEIRNLRSKVSSTRDCMLKEKIKNNSKVLEKLRKKLADLEGNLVLILPQLPFVMSHKDGKNYTFFLSSEFEKTQWIESIRVLQQSSSSSSDSVNFGELQAWIETCRKGLNPSVGSYLLRSNKDEDPLHGDLYLTIEALRGINQPSDLIIVIEVDTYGHFFQNATTKILHIESSEHYINQDYALDLDGSSNIRFICYEEVSNHKKPLLRGKAMLELGRSWLKDKPINKEIVLSDCKLSLSLKFVSSEVSTVRFPAGKVYGAFGVPIGQVTKKEKSNVPYLIVGCVKEVERRGVKEVGIYRVSGLSSDIQRLKKAFETNPYEAEHLLKEIDVHAITGLLKMYLRELPEALFTNSLYKKFFDAFNITNQDERRKRLTELFGLLPMVNICTINFLIDHFVFVSKYEHLNKMSLHNLATVFGPTLIRPGSSSSGTNNADNFTAGTIDVMAQAGLLHFFLFLKKKTVEVSTSV